MRGGSSKTMRSVYITDCYSCDSKTEAHEGDVHPLCEVCQENFDEWFYKEAQRFGAKVLTSN